MTKKLLTFIFAALLSATVFGQVDKEYNETLKKMFEISGSEETYKAVISQMFTMFKQQYSDVKVDVWNELEKEMSKTSLNDLIDMLISVYSKYMTKEDLEGLITFYETPVGKKFSRSTPLIMQESIQIGQQWGMKIGQEFVNKMKERGY